MGLYSDSARHGSVNYVIKKSVSRTGEGLRDGYSHKADWSYPFPVERDRCRV